MRARAVPAAALPASLYVTLLLVLPVLMLVWISLHRADASGGLAPGLTLANYGRILGERVYLEGLGGTLRMGLGVTLLTLLAGYPVALFIARSGSRMVPLVVGAAVLPLFVSVVVRSFGWMVVLGRVGPLNALLAWLSLTQFPIRFLNTTGAVVAGLVQILLPLMILPLAAVLRGVDRQLDEAALSLGASRWRVFATVVLPLSLPGVAAGCLLVLAHVIAAFVLPELLGSDSIRLTATMVFQQVMVVGDVPFGAAMALVMVVVSFLLLAAAQGLARRVRR